MVVTTPGRVMGVPEMVVTTPGRVVVIVVGAETVWVTTSVWWTVSVW